MESRSLTLLKQYPIQDGTNRYSICKVIAPNHSQNYIMMDDSLNKDSTDEESTSIEGECFIYIAGKLIYSIELKQPDYFNQQLCINLQKEMSALTCLTAFPLPQNMSHQQKKLPIATAILVICYKDQSQLGKLFFDYAEELKFVSNSQFLKCNIIWLSSHYIFNEQKSLLIIGYGDMSVGIHIMDFTNQIPQLVYQQTFQYQEQIVFQDLIYYDELFYLSLSSFTGQLSLLQIEFIIDDNHDYKLKIVHNQQHICRLISQPKFYFKNDLICLIVPIQEGQILSYENVKINGFKNYHLTTLPNNNNIMMTAFDIIQKKDEQGFSDYDEYEICTMHFDGTLQIYEMVENKLQIEMIKQLNYSRFYIVNMPFQFRQFILIGSTDNIEIYLMAYYQIN